MTIIDGKKIAGEILANLKKLPKPKKFLAAVLVGNDRSSISFLSQKEKTAKELGVDFRLYKLPADIKTDELRKEIGRLAGAANCGGFIVQLPLPEHVNRRYVLNAIPQDKDVDVLSEKAREAFSRGESRVIPPSIAVVEEIAKGQKTNLRESKVLAIGSGVLVGKPIGEWLRGKAKDVFVVDEFSGDFRNQLSDTDIVISGVGKASLFNGREVKEGALVIDFGYNTRETRDEKGEMRKEIAGDFDPAGADENRVFYTPTPGGTGPILVAKLFENFYKLNS